jgi:hypothetical protein
MRRWRTYRSFTTPEISDLSSWRVRARPGLFFARSQGGEEYEMDRSSSHGEEVEAGPPAAEIVQAGHEPDEISPRPIIRFAIGLIGIGIVAYVALWGLLKFFESQNEQNQPRLSPMASQQERLPPEPRLQMMPGSKSELKTPDYEMIEQRKDEQHQLETYGWTNKNTGAVRIPIDEAMKLIVQRGLPTQPQSGQGQPGLTMPTASSSGRVAEPRKE